MMTGTIRWNMVMGACGFVFTTLVSISSNLWSTSLIRGLIAGAIWFLLGFLLRYAAGILKAPGREEPQDQAAYNASSSGHNVDMSTPDETDTLKDLLRNTPTENEPKAVSHEEQEIKFEPLTPPKFVSKLPQDGEQLAQAVRHMAKE
ncbi:hypothetical protein [Paenibacillus aquistagni]|nr:hypothetical protein [Paenibacillus aquistagni]